MAPNYLSEMCQLVSSSEGLSRNRSAVRGDLISPAWNTVIYGQRHYEYAAAVVWNNIPINIRQKQSLMSFRKELKTYLFGLYNFSE